MSHNEKSIALANKVETGRATSTDVSGSNEVNPEIETKGSLSGNSLENEESNVFLLKTSAETNLLLTSCESMDEKEDNTEDLNFKKIMPSTSFVTDSESSNLSLNTNRSPNYDFVETLTREIEKVKIAQLIPVQKKLLLIQQYLSMGHGSYNKVSCEDMLKLIQQSPRTVVHCFEKPDTELNDIVGIHLNRMCIAHMETRFIKVDSNSIPTLNSKYGLTATPCLLMFFKGILKGMITNFDDVSNIQDYSYNLLEWKLAGFNVINYSKSLSKPPSTPKIVDEDDPKAL